MTDPAPLLDRAAAMMAEGKGIPYLGPGVLDLHEAPPVPITTRELADRLNRRVAVPARIRGNVWAVAQYIESFRHRKTLTGLMSEIFAPTPAPTALHRWLADLTWLPMVVDVWYDDALPAAFAGRAGWGLVQGASRAGENRDIWVRYFDAGGEEREAADAPGWRTLLYKPQGCLRPGGTFLLSDSDYVEALTEIDLQTPIPPEVQARRAGRGFLFLGCRFHDQMLRTYARQIMKRSAGPHFAVLPAEGLTRNEKRFLEEQSIVPILMPLAEAVARLTAPR
jgi:hypothetical protein